MEGRLADLGRWRVRYQILAYEAWGSRSWQVEGGLANIGRLRVG